MLSGGRGEESSKKFAMGVGEVGEFDPEAEAFEYVRDTPVELHRVTIRGENIQMEILANRYLRDRVDVASARADVADPCRMFS